MYNALKSSNKIKMSVGPVCKLCLFKTELIEDEFELHTNTNRLYQILKDLFCNKIEMTENELQIVCKSCNEKLESFHEYYRFVLDNQIKYQLNFNTKHENASIESFVSCIENEENFPEFVEVVKIEPKSIPISSIDDYVVEETKPIDQKELEFIQDASEVEDNHEDFVMNYSDIEDEEEDIKITIDSATTKSNTEVVNNDLSHSTSQSSTGNNKTRSKDGRFLRVKSKKPRRVRPKKQQKSKLTQEQLEQKNQTYQMITEFYEMICDHCDGQPTFSSYADLIKHGRKEHGRPRIWTCCDFRLASTTQLYEHAMRHKNPDECRHCGEKFTGLKQIKVHKCPNAPKYICNECGKPCPNKCAVRDHLRVVHFPDFIYCELCGRGFNKAYMHKFRQHMEYDHGNLKPEDMFKPCPTCGVLVNTRNYGMKDHIRERHEKPARETGPSICNQCNKQFAHHKNLQRHIREEHILGRRHRCEFCNKGFLNLKCLKEHVAIHTGLPNYICEYCEATFKSNGNFCAHKRRLHPVEYAAEKAARAKPIMFIKRDVSQIL